MVVPESPPTVAPAPQPRSPWAFVPSLYFAEGLPYILVNLASIPMLKGLGVENEVIGLATSLLSLPWVLKVLWSPFVERVATKRRWILVTQLLLCALLAGVAFGLLSSWPVAMAIALFVPVGFVSATHDVAIDGYYLEALSEKHQAFFVGIRTTAYKVAWLFGTGGLVYLAGKLGDAEGSLAVGWSIALGIAAVLLGALWVYHWRALPFPEAAPRAAAPTFAQEFVRAVASYLRQPKIGAVLWFILLFRLGDALLLRMAQPFLMDERAVGGLGLTTEEIGIVYGTVGTLFSLGGGILGGLLIARGGLRRWMLRIALFQNGLILLYFALALTKPGIEVVALANAFEQLAFGLGVSAYGVFLMQTVQPEFKATHYAIATSLMAVGWAVPGAVSGWLENALGYAPFFLLCFVASLPGLALTRVVPYRS